jgi:hypothetical protein
MRNSRLCHALLKNMYCKHITRRGRRVYNVSVQLGGALPTCSRVYTLLEYTSNARAHAMGD